MFTFYDRHVFSTKDDSTACYCCSEQDQIVDSDFKDWSSWTDGINSMNVYTISCSNPTKFDIKIDDGTCRQCNLYDIADEDHKSCIPDPVLENR